MYYMYLQHLLNVRINRIELLPPYYGRYGRDDDVGDELRPKEEKKENEKKNRQGTPG